MTVDRIHVGLASALWVGLAACSSSSSGLPATAYVEANVSGASCDLASTLFTMGSLDAPVQNGAAGAAVSCSVHANGGGFDVTLKVEQGTNIFQASGHVPADDGVTPNTAGALTADLDSDSQGVPIALYDGSTCVLTYQNLGDESAVESGRIWGSLNCTSLADTAKPVQTPTGTSYLTCSGTIAFQFTNCAQ
ncbi:MAG: hypothetical protein ABTD50_01730 [Polyangiaceae bacterium]|jgi:hypothetical protein